MTGIGSAAGFNPRIPAFWKSDSKETRSHVRPGLEHIGEKTMKTFETASSLVVAFASQLLVVGVLFSFA